MDDQTLDRLLTNRAVGQLDDDVAELLSDYLAEHPELQERAGPIEQTVQLAERAFQEYDSCELPPLDRLRVDKSRRLSHRSKLLLQAGTVAAAFFLGVSTVLMTGPAERLNPEDGRVARAGSEPLVVYPTAQPISDENFWSLERVPVTAQVRNVARPAHPSRDLRQAIEATFR
jgi:anti-sigma factor RsiW